VIGLCEIVAATPRRVERVLLVEGGDEVDLPAFAEDDALDRRTDLHLAAWPRR
jgi:hypothetical protein